MSESQFSTSENGPLIRVMGLSKAYQKGELGKRRRLRDVLMGHGGSGDCLQALKDVSFTLTKGESLALVGANGAGKSTLLKILSKVTAPTDGSVHLFGTLASLLEVGTGFHPELSGRDNIVLGSTILGRTKAAVRQDMDAIIAFAELAEVIDMPLKRYSTGMYVRLAFAVASFLKPDVLLVDEILTVSDAAFRQKAIEHLRKHVNDGRSLIMVSHQDEILQSLCHRALWLERGRVLEDGSISSVLSAYHKKNNDRTHMKEKLA